MVSTHKEIVRQILHDKLNLTKTEETNLLTNVFTSDETWIFQYDLKTKSQSMHWKTPTTAGIEKVLKSELKTMLIVVFDIKVGIMIDWILEG